MKCPECGRKFDEPGDGRSFILGDHLNYMKTAPCPGSGREYGFDDERLLLPDLASIDMLTLATVAAWASRGKRRGNR